MVDESGVIAWRYVAPQGAHPNPEDLLNVLRQMACAPANDRGWNTSCSPSLTRRHFLAISVAAAIAVAFVSLAERATAQGEGACAAMTPLSNVQRTMDVTIDVNGTDHALTIDPRDKDNGFQIELAKRTLIRALTIVSQIPLPADVG